MNGYTHDEFVGMHGSEFVHPAHVWQFRDSVAAIQAGGSYSAESVNLRKDGTPLPIEVRITPFTHQGETVLLCSIRDITERRQAAATRAELEVQHHQIQKAESLGLMAASIAHHFNNMIRLEELEAMNQPVTFDPAETPLMRQRITLI